MVFGSRKRKIVRFNCVWVFDCYKHMEVNGKRDEPPCWEPRDVSGSLSKAGAWHHGGGRLKSWHWYFILLWNYPKAILAHSFIFNKTNILLNFIFLLNYPQNAPIALLVFNKTFSS